MTMVRLRIPGIIGNNFSKLVHHNKLLSNCLLIILLIMYNAVRLGGFYVHNVFFCSLDLKKCMESMNINSVKMKNVGRRGVTSNTCM